MTSPTKPEARRTTRTTLQGTSAMKHPTAATTHDREQRPDPNAELHARERLRMVVALGALLLGFVAALHL
jgi:hypothetical protein